MFHWVRKFYCLLIISGNPDKAPAGDEGRAYTSMGVDENRKGT